MCYGVYFKKKKLIKALIIGLVDNYSYEQTYTTHKWV